jgi:hypothetical protein
MTSQDADLATRATDWLAARLPDRWLASPPVVEVDDDEILVLLPLADRIDPRQFRDATRAERIAVAREAEEAFGRRISWATVAGGTRNLFTSVRVPVTAPLAMSERRVLDSLVEAGVAQDRSHAVAWCIRLVGRHEADWLRDLRDSVSAAPVERPFQI